MKHFLKQNLVLVMGISLPLLLIGVLLLLHGISRLTTTGPAYPVLYVSFDSYYGRQFWDFDIDQAGRLNIGFMLPSESLPAIRQQPADATLALFDAGTDTLATFRLKSPEDPSPGQRTARPVPEELLELTLSEKNAAPDGYRLELSTYRGGGLLSEIFGTGGRSRHHRLVRDGVSFRVPDIGSASRVFPDAFVGWVVEGDE